MTSTPPRPCRQLLWKLFLVAAVMFALAVMTISTQGFWIDEACTGTIAVQPTLASWWQAMLDDTGSTTQMPLYTIYTWSWGKIFGHNEWWLRLSNLPWLALGLPANQPPPDLLILSKPDIHDKNGLMRSYLANHHCVVLQTLPSFTLWRKNVD